MSLISKVILTLFLATVLSSFVFPGDWQGPLSICPLPGCGEMLSQNAYVLGNFLHQGFWRDHGECPLDNQGWARSVPVVNGVPVFPDPPNWGAPIDIDDLPGDGYGDMQAQTGYVLGDLFYQGFWRGNYAWVRKVPVRNNQVIGNEAPDWSKPIPHTGLPGSGDMEAQTTFVMLGKRWLWQSFWRGGERFVRAVPIDNNIPDFPEATDWDGPYDVSCLPGSLTMQSENIYTLGDNMHLGFWRDNEGWTRKIRIKCHPGFILDPYGESELEWPFEESDWEDHNTSDWHRGDDFYALDWLRPSGIIEGKKVYPMAPGIVIYAGRSNNPGWWQKYGYQVVVRCLHNPKFAYRLARLQSIDPDIKAGDFVGLDTLIGYVGHTGGSEYPPDPHLHAVLYKKIGKDNSVYYLKQGKSPSGYISSSYSPSQFAADYNTDSNNQ